LRSISKTLFFASLVTCAAAAMPSSAALIPVPNSSFEDWSGVGTTSSSWFPTPSNPPLPAQISGAVSPNHWSGEFSSNAGTFGSGWLYTGNAPTFPNGQWGLNHPADSHYQNVSDGTAAGRKLVGNFDGEFIGRMNLRTNWTPNFFTGYTQSGILGQLSAAGGGYTVEVGVGVRHQSGWDDVNYQLAVVADPTASGVGSTGGTVLGTPATITLVPTTAVFGANTTLLTYTLPLDVNDSMIGHDYAIRITATDPGTMNGVPNAPGFQSFTQANFDNVKLFDTVVPEPTTAAAGAGAALLLFASRTRHRRNQNNRVPRISTGPE
jgi:hypothetical protein